MLVEKSLVLYKNKAAIIRESGDKITIDIADGTSARVREKDIEPLHPGPILNFSALNTIVDEDFAALAWELCSEEGAELTLRTLAELAGGWTPENAWRAYLILADALYFEGGVNALRPKQKEAVETEKARRSAKLAEETERNAFLLRLKSKKLDLPSDLRFMQDVEALAMGKSPRSRTLKEAGVEETEEAAYSVLLETGVWDAFVNPYPSRYAVSTSPPKAPLDTPAPEDKRQNLRGLAAFAIDDEFSDDPDDAISLETTNGGYTLYVHVADPSCALVFDGPAEQEARNRGATLYTPEGKTLMLCEEVLRRFALGLEETSAALTIKITLDAALNIINTEIFRSEINVKRLSYQKAMDEAELAGFFELARRNIKHRLSFGAALIEFPEVEITVKGREITITPVKNLPSRALVRECMLLAGEAAASWALEKRIPFPYITQEMDTVKDGADFSLAGAYQLRRHMRPRVLSCKPGLHSALGLDIYTQVTSPLRRYTDLLAHFQISAALRGHTPLDEDTLLARLAASERAALAVSRAERASRAHWTAVYLSSRIGECFNGVVLEQRGPHALLFIPELGIEVQTAAPRGGELAPNETRELKLCSVNLSRAASSWTVI
ncbi:MAG: RNB domain-containing ribonuclease [Spirochaetaceae bacterium]|jgi:exoribonuclease-2|nr:RNB domain-containing ribonuclease [Spirochaetaceae bacterium]